MSDFSSRTNWSQTISSQAIRHSNFRHRQIRRKVLCRSFRRKQKYNFCILHTKLSFNAWQQTTKYDIILFPRRRIYRQKNAGFVHIDLYFSQRLLNLYGFMNIQSAQYLPVLVKVGRIYSKYRNTLDFIRLSFCQYISMRNCMRRLFLRFALK